MKAYEVIKLACQMTDNESLGDKLTETNITAENAFSTKEKQTLQRYLNALNFVQDEVATEWQCLVYEEKIKPENFKIPVSSFSKPICDVLSVKDEKGRNVKFKIYPTYILAFANEVIVKYVYTCAKAELGSDLEVALPEHILACGVAREYCLRLGLGEDADMFERRFKDGLKVLLRKKSEVKMPRRRWL